MEDSWMFRELSPPAAGLAEALQGFSEMLSAGHRVVDLATQALLGTLESVTCREEILQTEERIDSLERSIRRRVTVHAMAYSGTEVAICLGLMSLVKDAERIGDYGTALFSLSEWLGTDLRASVATTYDEYRNRLCNFWSAVGTRLMLATNTRRNT